MSNITIQLTALLGGVVVILVGLTLSDLVTAAVAGANTYEVRYNTVRNSDEVLGECVFQSQPKTALDKKGMACDLNADGEPKKDGKCVLTQTSEIEENSDPDIPTDYVFSDLDDLGTPAVTVRPGDSVVPIMAPIDNNPMLDCGLGTFTGSSAVLFLVPIVWFLVVLSIGLSMIGFAGLGIAGRGPLAGGR